MSDIKILHTADIHIGSSRTALSRSSISGSLEIKNTFFKIINMCKAENVDFLLIAGDLFENPFADSDTVSEIIHAISQIPETVVAISAGNHDCACPGTVYLKYKFPTNTIIFTSFLEYVDFSEKKTRLWGAGFTDNHENIRLLSDKCPCPDDYINICVMHGDLVSGMSDSVYNPITPSQIQASELDYLALGHIHKRSEIEKIDKTYYSYSGCPDGRGFDEDGSKGVYLGVVGKGTCSLEYIETWSRMYIHETIDVSECETSLQASNKILSVLTDKYSDNVSRHLYKVSMVGCLNSGISLNPRQITAHLEEQLTYCNVADNTETDFSDIEAMSGEVSLRGIFIKKMLERISAAPDSEQKKLRLALKTGLRAFDREVKLNDN